MKHVLPLLCLLILLVASGCVSKASGGGWFPSADEVAGDKATFGFNYKCDDTDHTLTGHLSYHDHGTGHRLAAKINDILFNPDGTPIGCGVLIEPGISGACGVVKTGSGGVLPGDLVLVVTGDGLVLDGTNASDVILIGLWHPPTPLDQNMPLPLTLCAEIIVDMSFPGVYYVNQGVLGGGNITWFAE